MRWRDYAREGYTYGLSYLQSGEAVTDNTITSLDAGAPLILHSDGYPLMRLIFLVRFC
jgi:hypothetical protein